MVPFFFSFFLNFRHELFSSAFHFWTSFSEENVSSVVTLMYFIEGKSIRFVEKKSFIFK